MSERGHAIGFNDDVMVGSVTFHVQTEVVGAPPKVLTNVMQGGRLAHSVRRPYPDDESDLDRVRAIIAEQHAEVIALVQRGEVA